MGRWTSEDPQFRLAGRCIFVSMPTTPSAALLMFELITLLPFVDAWLRDGRHFGEQSGVAFVGLPSDSHPELRCRFLDWVCCRKQRVVLAGGDTHARACHKTGLCRYELGELDEVIPELRLRGDEPFLVLPEKPD